MKSALIGIAVVMLLAVSFAPQAEASAFMTVTVGATSVTCNNSTAALLAACPAGFSSPLGVGGNSLTFSGTVAGYTFGQTGIDGISLSSNAPGTLALAQVADAKNVILHNSGTDPAQVDFGVNGFTNPLGAGTLSATHSGNTPQASSGSETFQGWERNDGLLNAGPAGATAVSNALACTFPGAAPPTQTCSGATATVGSPNVTTGFAITGREIITTAVGSQTQFQASIALTATTPPPQVPEPSTLLLLGTGMLFLAGRSIHNRRK